MRILGIDFGERRIGIAISDPGGTFALPLVTLTRTTDAQALAAIVDLARQEEISRIVVGEPLRADGSVGTAAERVRAFAARLARMSELPVETIDESLTSRAADERLAEAGVPKAKRREKRDMLAAQLVLQEALDRASASQDDGGKSRAR